MLELTVLTGSCTLELKFLAEQAVDVFRLRSGERLLISDCSEIFRVTPLRQPEAGCDRQEVLDQRVEQWRQHIVQLLSKS